MTLNETVVSILAEDLGPSAQSFFVRQCKSHLNKEPENITKEDLDELAKWCYTGVKLILGDDIANKVNKKILSLKN